MRKTVTNFQDDDEGFKMEGGDDPMRTCSVSVVSFLTCYQGKTVPQECKDVDFKSISVRDWLTEATAITDTRDTIFLWEPARANQLSLMSCPTGSSIPLVKHSPEQAASVERLAPGETSGNTCAGGWLLVVKGKC